MAQKKLHWAADEEIKFIAFLFVKEIQVFYLKELFQDRIDER